MEYRKTKGNSEICRSGKCKDNEYLRRKRKYLKLPADLSVSTTEINYLYDLFADVKYMPKQNAQYYSVAEIYVKKTQIIIGVVFMYVG